jgi:RNA polymerase sigma-70 factor (ECF subfamily)
VNLAEQRRIVDAFIAACAGGEIEALLPLLDPSVVGWADVGGTLLTVRRPNVGLDQVSHGVMNFFGPASGATLMARDVNGEPGIIAFRNRAVWAVLALTVRRGRISGIYAVADPRKLARVEHALHSGH